MGRPWVSRIFESSRISGEPGKANCVRGLLSIGPRRRAKWSKCSGCRRCWRKTRTVWVLYASSMARKGTSSKGWLRATPWIAAPKGASLGQMTNGVALGMALFLLVRRRGWRVSRGALDLHVRRNVAFTNRGIHGVTLGVQQTVPGDGFLRDHGYGTAQRLTIKLRSAGLASPRGRFQGHEQTIRQFFEG